jgi:hypothetical protein
MQSSAISLLTFIPGSLAKALGSNDVSQMECTASAQRNACLGSSAWAQAAEAEFTGFKFGQGVSAMSVKDRKEFLKLLKSAVVPSGVTVVIEDRAAAKALVKVLADCRKSMNKYTFQTCCAAKVVIGSIPVEDLQSKSSTSLQENWTQVLGAAADTSPLAYVVDVHFADGTDEVIPGVNVTAARSLLHSNQAKLCMEVGSKILQAKCTGGRSVNVGLLVRDVSGGLDSLDFASAVPWQRSNIMGVLSLNLDRPRGELRRKFANGRM